MLRLVSRHFSLRKSCFGPGAVLMGLMAVRVSFEKGLLWGIWVLPLTCFSTNALHSSMIREWAVSPSPSAVPQRYVLMPPHV